MEGTHRKHSDIQRDKDYIKEVNTLLTCEKGLFKIRQRLIKPPEPVLFLTRTSGEKEVYTGVKGKEFMVPKLPDGVEKKIHLGAAWQDRIPWANETIRVYWCHEDYAFPHKWSEPNIYHGKNVQSIKNYVEVNKDKDLKQIPIILESANINAEAFRDRERKILIAWEKFTAKQSTLNIQAYAKFALYVGAAIALVAFVYYMWGPKESVDTAAIAKDAAKQAIAGIQIG